MSSDGEDDISTPHSSSQQTSSFGDQNLNKVVNKIVKSLPIPCPNPNPNPSGDPNPEKRGTVFDDPLNFS